MWRSLNIVGVALAGGSEPRSGYTLYSTPLGVICLAYVSELRLFYSAPRGCELTHQPLTSWPSEARLGIRAQARPYPPSEAMSPRFLPTHLIEIR